MSNNKLKQYETSDIAFHQIEALFFRIIYNSTIHTHNQSKQCDIK